MTTRSVSDILSSLKGTKKGRKLYCSLFPIALDGTYNCTLKRLNVHNIVIVSNDGDELSLDEEGCLFKGGSRVVFVCNGSKDWGTVGVKYLRGGPYALKLLTDAGGNNPHRYSCCDYDFTYYIDAMDGDIKQVVHGTLDECRIQTYGTELSDELKKLRKEKLGESGNNGKIFYLSKFELKNGDIKTARRVNYGMYASDPYILEELLCEKGYHEKHYADSFATWYVSPKDNTFVYYINGMQLMDENTDKSSLYCSFSCL